MSEEREGRRSGREEEGSSSSSDGSDREGGEGGAGGREGEREVGATGNDERTGPPPLSLSLLPLSPMEGSGKLERMSASASKMFGRMTSVERVGRIEEGGESESEEEGERVWICAVGCGFQVGSD